jgi:hypothetical protein
VRAGPPSERHRRPAERLRAAVPLLKATVPGEDRRTSTLDRHPGNGPGLLATRPGQLIIADKDCVSAELDRWLAERGARLLQPSYRNRTPHPGEHPIKPVRRLIESVDDSLKGQLDLELHGGRTIEGVGARVAQHVPALTAAIWHNHAAGQPCWSVQICGRCAASCAESGDPRAERP